MFLFCFEKHWIVHYYCFKLLKIKFSFIRSTYFVKILKLIVPKIIYIYYLKK